MTNCTPETVLFPTCRKHRVEARFDGGVLLLRSADRVLGLTAADRDRPLASAPTLCRFENAPLALDGARCASIRDALADGPKSFATLMAAIGTRDGREVVLALDELRATGRLTRVEDGAYALKRETED